MFLGVGQAVVVIVLVRVVDGLNGKILVEGCVFVVHDPDVERVAALLQRRGAKEVPARDREEIFVGRSVPIEEAELVGVLPVGIIRVARLEYPHQFARRFVGMDDRIV